LNSYKLDLVFSVLSSYIPFSSCLVLPSCSLSSWLQSLLAVSINTMVLLNACNSVRTRWGILEWFRADPAGMLLLALPTVPSGPYLKPVVYHRQRAPKPLRLHLRIPPLQQATSPLFQLPLPPSSPQLVTVPPPSSP